MPFGFSNKNLPLEMLKVTSINTDGHFLKFFYFERWMTKITNNDKSNIDQQAEKAYQSR